MTLMFVAFFLMCTSDKLDDCAPGHLVKPYLDKHLCESDLRHLADEADKKGIKLLGICSDINVTEAK